MRRIRAICLMVSLIGLAGSARAQYYPTPQAYYPPYARPNSYPAPSYYGNYPSQPAPAYLPGYYAAPRPPANPPTPVAVETERVNQAQSGAQEQLPPSEIAQPEPETLLPGEPSIAPRGPSVGRPVQYTIPAIIASFPYESPRPGNLFWVKSEYLLWRMRAGPPQYPLVTTDSNPGPVNAGSLISPTATTLFGTDGFRYGTFNGGRLTAGFWLDQEQRFGIEASGFLQETRSVRFHVGSDGPNAALYLPSYNILRGTEASLIVADPTVPLTGTVDLAASMQLWGAEVNGVYRLMRTGSWDVQLLAGFRYLELIEAIQLQNSTDGFNQTAYLTDRFQSRNQFYGPQIGVRGDYTYGRFSAGLSAKFALGVTHEVTEIAGYNTAPATGSLAGGYFSQPTNMGRTMLNSLSAAPQFAVTFGYNLTERVTLFAGYDYLLWTNVARAGDQIDRVLNLSQSAAFGGGVLTNILGRPEPLSNRSDFWAQGISLGVQYRY